jgi:hypothetical protein
MRGDPPSPTWPRGRWATCSAATSRAWPSSAAPTCATSSTPSPSCCRDRLSPPADRRRAMARQRLPALTRHGYELSHHDHRLHLLHPGLRHPRRTSRLPQVGTTIFTVMSALAQQRGAVNLGQGFPDFECDPRLLDARWARRWRRPEPVPADGRRAGAAPGGVRKIEPAVRPPLRPRHRRSPSPPAPPRPSSPPCWPACSPGDEVIVLEPCYDSYAPNIELAGGTVVRVPLTPGSFRPDFAHRRGAHAAHAGDHRQLAAQPQRHGLDARRDAALAELLAPTEVLLISDEVYEHMVFDGSRTSAPRPSRRWRRAPSWSPASARPTTSPAGRWAPWRRRRR